MCGIFSVFNYKQNPIQARQRALKLSKKIRHRGPDWSGCRVIKNHIISHERLAIVGVESGAQPLSDNEDATILSVNGEIYNYRELRQKLSKASKFKTESDCEIIIYLYKEFGVQCVDMLDGIFSFILYDAVKDEILVARDPIGVTTLYAGYNTTDHSLWFASEMKCLNEDCDQIISFPPGCYLSLRLAKDLVYDTFEFDAYITRYFKPKWFDPQCTPSLAEFPEPNYKAIRHSLEEAVHKRLMSEVPFGVLLSGGLDSSLIASIAARAIQKYSKHQEGMNGTNGADIDYDRFDHIKALQWWPRLHSFSIGASKDAPDLKAAVEVAKFIGTVHHEYTFTIEEGLDALSDVVYHLETYDVTTIRASTPMYLLSRRIKSLGVKMVLSGEGSDEIFGGYLYFFNAPSAKDFHTECVERVKNLHLSDCLRANKSTLAWGLEARVPFLDKQFLEVALEQTPPEFKMCTRDHMEKYVLRKAFDDPSHPYLPHNILWRQKEQFSDGVGYNWIDELKRWTDTHVTNEEMQQAPTRFPYDTPTTKEAYHYRVLFEHHFPQVACARTVKRWIPRRDWGCAEDPSGRAQKAHTSSYANPN